MKETCGTWGEVLLQAVDTCNRRAREKFPDLQMPTVTHDDLRFILFVAKTGSIEMACVAFRGDYAARHPGKTAKFRMGYSRVARCLDYLQ